MSDRLVIYHGPGCADGFTSAWAAWRLLGDSAIYLPAQYGDAPPDVRGKDVLVVDFSYPRQTLEKMASDAASIRVLDHHRTAESDLRDLPFCTFDMTKSGARLAWEYIARLEYQGQPPEFCPPPRTAPGLIDYVEDRDLWKWRLKNSKEVSAYISTLDHEFVEWNALADDLVHRFMTIVHIGEACLRQIDKYAKAVAPHAIRRMVAGHAVPIVSAAAPHTSELLHMLSADADFAVSWWQRADGRFQYSLRADGQKPVHVGFIAKEFGGGGHAGAGGFDDAKPPWELFPEVKNV